MSTEERTRRTRISDDGRRLITIERWLDRQIDPPRWRSKNWHRTLKPAEVEYYRQQRERVRVNDWSGITDGGESTNDLSLIYHSLDAEFDPEMGRYHVSFNKSTWAEWERILDEIGAELDRRREARTGHPGFKHPPRAQWHVDIVGTEGHAGRAE